MIIDTYLQHKNMTLQEYKEQIVKSMRGDSIALHCLAKALETKITTLNPFTMEETSYPQEIKESPSQVFEKTIRLLAYPYGNTLRVLPLKKMKSFLFFLLHLSRFRL